MVWLSAFFDNCLLEIFIDKSKPDYFIVFLCMNYSNIKLNKRRNAQSRLSLDMAMHVSKISAMGPNIFWHLKSINWKDTKIEEVPTFVSTYLPLVMFHKISNKNKSTWSIIIVKSNFLVCFLGELWIPKSLLKLIENVFWVLGGGSLREANVTS